jgi:dipeptidyl aminopeptidase/acylaminoacyl peptidase
MTEQPVTAAQAIDAKPPRRQQPITARALLEAKSLSDPKLHPDGQRIVFVAAEADFDESCWISHLWLTEWLPPDDRMESDETGEADEANEANAATDATATPAGEPGQGVAARHAGGSTETAETETNEDEDVDPTRQLTFSREGETHPQWSYDGRFLAFLSARPDETEPGDDDDDNEPTEQIWVLPIDGGEARKITSAKEGVIDYAWAPDANELIFLAPEPRPRPVEAVRKEERNRRKVDPIVEHDDLLRRQLWRVDVEDRKPKLLFTADYGVTEFVLSPDGARLCYATNHTGIQNDYHLVDLYVRDLESGDTFKLVERAGGKYHPRWSPDGSRIAFLSWLDPQLSYSRESLFVADVPPTGALAGAPPAECLLYTEETYDRDINEFHWSRHDNALYAFGLAGTGADLIRVEDGATQLLAHADEVQSDLHMEPGGLRAVFVQESATALPEIILRDEEGGLHPLTKLNADFSANHLLPRQEVVQWTSRDGLAIEGVLTYPLGYREGERYPLVVQIHGGPKGRSTDTLRSYGMPPVWSAEGYAVLRPNFRGGEGYGNAFAIANRRDLGGGDYEDIMAGVDWCLAQGIADPTRLGVMGGSYGGYMTNWIIGQTDRFAAAISMFGIFHLQTDYSNSELSRWDNDYLGAYYWEDPDIYRRLSPGSYVDRIKTPTLIIHGDDDDNTFISNSKELYQALRHRGVTTQFVHYPREGHGVREPNHRLDEMRRCLAWMDRYARSGGRNPDLYRLEDKIQSADGRFELCVTRAEIAVFAGQPKPSTDPAERATATALLETAFTLRYRAVDAPPAPLTLSLDNVRLELKRDTADGATLLPCGVPLDIHGVKVLVEGDNLRIAQHPDTDTGQLAFACGAVFRVPLTGGEALLRIADFPPIKVQWGAEDEEQAEREAEKPAEEHQPHLTHSHGSVARK